MYHVCHIINQRPQLSPLIGIEVMSSQLSFIIHIWQSVFIIKLKLAAPFSSSTADGPNTGSVFTAWQRIEGFCHDCLGYPLILIYFFYHLLASRWCTEYLSQWAGGVHSVDFDVCLKLCNFLTKSRTCYVACLTQIWHLWPAQYSCFCQNSINLFSKGLPNCSTMYNN